MELMKAFSFEASHILPKHPGKCSRLHGHSWKLRVYVKGEVNEETGFVLDYHELKVSLNYIIEALDHHHLGTWYNRQGKPEETNFFVPEWQVGPEHYLPENFYPTSENLIVWIAEQIDKKGFINHGSDMQWSRLELDETCTSSCILTREDYDREIRRR